MSWTNRDLIKAYRSFEKKVPILPADPTIGNLVRFNGNKIAPIHRWFIFKEGFSADLLSWLCETTSCELNSLEYILDPFCGVATSLLSAQFAYGGDKKLYAYGIEHNPFIRFVADAKLSWPKYRIDKIEELIPKFIAHQLTERRAQYEVPTLSTIQDPRVFAPHVVQELLAIRNRIHTVLAGEPEERFFLLGWAAAIEKVSGVRKDGRALRFEEKDDIPTVTEALREQWALMLCDLQQLTQDRMNPKNVECKVLAGDGRTLQVSEIESKRFDLILYSPPYLNNIDYSEVYKLELWLSGHINTQEEFKALRLGSFRSHPSIKFPETDLVDSLPERSWARRLREALLDVLPKDKDLVWRTRLIRSYMDDMYQALSAQFAVVKRRGQVVCVVGNSLHGSRDHPIPVATDLLISALAQSVGFEVERLQVARQLRRRDHDNDTLRESIIVLRRPRTTQQE